jgi:antitoxin CptB
MTEIGNARVAWACRRGMLELDWFLVRFFNRCYPALSPEQQELFYTFLSSEDVDLHDWLMDRAEAPEAYRELVALIRSKVAGMSDLEPLS